MNIYSAKSNMKSIAFLLKDFYQRNKNAYFHF